MNKQERRAWRIVASLFVTLAVVWGVGYDIIGIFFHPLHKEFGWNRTQMSLLATSLSISYGICLPLVGWLLDRVDARVVIGTGAACVGIALVTASQAHSLTALLVAFWILGAGTAAASLMPAAVVITNWFGDRRGTALGTATAGVPVGEFTMTIAASTAIAFSGWRLAYVILALPLFIIIVPLVFLTVRTRAASATAGLSVAQASDARPGLDVGVAIKTRAFWMVGAIWFFYTITAGVVIVHGVPYLEGLGYTQQHAAKIWAALLGSTIIGRPATGFLADKIGSRQALLISFAGMAVSMLFLMGAENVLYLAGFFVLFGLLIAAPVSALPMLQAETLGLKRFGAISGLTNLGFSLGLAIGPLIAGYIFDMTGSYQKAFMVSILFTIAGAGAVVLCTTPEATLAEERRTATSVASH